MILLSQRSERVKMSCMLLDRQAIPNQIIGQLPITPLEALFEYSVMSLSSLLEFAQFYKDNNIFSKEDVKQYYYKWELLRQSSGDQEKVRDFLELFIQKVRTYM